VQASSFLFGLWRFNDVYDEFLLKGSSIRATHLLRDAITVALRGQLGDVPLQSIDFNATAIRISLFIVRDIKNLFSHRIESSLPRACVLIAETGRVFGSPILNCRSGRHIGFSGDLTEGEALFEQFEDNGLVLNEFRFTSHKREDKSLRQQGVVLFACALRH
jgi:hypothetical protein